MGFPARFFWRVERMRIERPPVQPQLNPAEDRNSPLWQAAQGMEANFLREMIRNMRKTIEESPEMANSKAFQTFRSMLDDHYAETAAKTQGIGLAELIVKQVMEQQEAARKQQAVPVRELNKSDVIGK
jgi:peptidoglycan hydrolase FlgJ